MVGPVQTVAARTSAGLTVQARTRSTVVLVPKLPRLLSANFIERAVESKNAHNSEFIMVVWSDFADGRLGVASCENSKVSMASDDASKRWPAGRVFDV